MIAIADNEPISSRLGTHGPWLPLVVSKAATEFDRALQGQKVDFVSARRLAEYLKQTLGGPAAVGASAASFDVSAVGIMSRALESQVTRGATFAEIVNKAWDIAQRMESTQQNTDRTALEQYRAFCVAFGNSLISYRESLNRFRPSNPHKR